MHRGVRDDTPLPPCMPISKVTNGIILSLESWST